MSDHNWDDYQEVEGYDDQTSRDLARSEVNRPLTEDEVKDLRRGGSTSTGCLVVLLFVFVFPIGALIYALA